MAFSENVVTLEKGDKTFYIVGTAHISQKSVEEVGQVIDEVKPDTVCVELCQTRYESLTQEDQWKKLNIIQVIKQGKALMLLANLALSAFQRKMGKDLGVKPGSELLEGVKKAEENDAKLVLADRDIQTTLKRTWANLSFWKKFLVMGGLMESVIFKEKISEEELESLKEGDQLSEMMEEFAKAMPEVKEPLIDERDQYLTAKIREAEGEKIVAVVGAGHVKGMVKHFDAEIDTEKISVIPPPKKWVKSLKWVIPIFILSLFSWGIYKHQGEALQDMLMAWVIPNAIGSALFTIFAGGHIFTILTAGLAAPITSLNPALGAGMVAGLVEGLIRKPSVDDCERIPEDIESLGGFYRNNFTRVLLVFFLANLGSALGTWIGAAWVVKIFAS
ncbi:MAG: TraB/GumN family protein [Acidobacteriota bacterium]|nr:TraB/GumN family protein [Acidobacteriota bacterium]